MHGDHLEHGLAQDGQQESGSFMHSLSSIPAQPKLPLPSSLHKFLFLSSTSSLVA